MISKEDVLQAEGIELSKLAGEILQPEPYEHDTYLTWTKGGPISENTGYKCIKCGEFQKLEDWEKNETACGIPDLLKPTPDNQVKWRDWCESKCSPSDFEDAMYSVYNSTKYHDVMTYSLWLLRKATPSDYIKAICLCKIEGEK